MIKLSIRQRISAYMKGGAKGGVKRGIVVAPLILVSFLGGVLFAPLWSAGDTTVVSADEHHAGHQTQTTVWTCSMHPQVRQPEPGLCPLCAMDLIPLQNNENDPGPKTVILSPRAKILAKISTTPVRRKASASTDIRLLGRIEANEAAMKNVTAWIGGRIDKLNVKATGESVRAGQTIASLYSPEIFAAHQDLIVAKRQQTRIAGGTESAKLAARRMYDASKKRLQLLGVPEDTIGILETKDTPNTRIGIRTPFAGTVVERVATEGAYVETGALLYKIVNLSSVWVQLDAYENDLPNIERNQEVKIQVEGILDETFSGKITFIEPILDTNRRVARVRVVVKNIEGRLRPGMFVEAEIQSTLAKGMSAPLVVPETAPLFTGRRSVVFVEDPNAERPTYTARTVRLGLKTGDQYPVIAGLSEGESVVTKGAFTLDADLQIRGGSSMMTAPDDTTSNRGDRIIAITAKERKKWAPTLEAYLELQRALAADEFEAAKVAATTLVKRSGKARINGPEAAAHFWKQHRKQLFTHGTALAATPSIEEARGVFEPLSNQIISLLERLGNPMDVPVRLAFCPMAMGSKGASWVQKGEVVDNAYYGDVMRTCGEIKSTVDGGSYLMSAMPAPVQAAPAGGHQH